MWEQCTQVNHAFMRRRPMMTRRRWERMLTAAESAPATAKTCTAPTRWRSACGPHAMKAVRMVPCYTPDGVLSFMQPVQERLVFT